MAQAGDAAGTTGAAAGAVEIDVLGPLRVRVRGHDVTDALPEQLRPLIGALALAAGPIDKHQLAREVLFLSPASIDARLSRLRAALGLERPIHRAAPARSGRIELDRAIARVDGDHYREAVARAAARPDARSRIDAFVEADRAWRASPYGAAWTGGGSGGDPVTAGRAELIRLRHDAIAETCRLALRERVPLDPRGLEAWTQDHPDLGLAWFTRIVLLFDREGPAAAGEAMEAWDRASVTGGTDWLRGWAGRLLAYGRSRSLGPDGLPPFVAAPIGREAVAAEVAEILDAALAGDHRVAVVEGVAGSGKTTLLDHVVARARGAAMVVGVADADERYGLPALVRSALDPLWQSALRDPEPSPGLRRRADALALLLDSHPVAPGATRAPVDPVPHAKELIEELVRSLTQRRAVLLAFDNADRAREVLEPLIDALAAARIPGLALLATSREPFLPDPPASTRRFHLGELDAAAVLRLIHAVRGADADVPPRAHPHAPATPLAVLQGEAGVGASPASLREAFESRPPRGRRALALAALSARGTRCRVELVDAVARDDAILDALGAEAEHARIVSWDGSELVFTHRAWQELAIDALDPIERGHLHGLAAQHLELELSRASDDAAVHELAYDLAEHARQCDRSPRSRAIAAHALVRSAEILSTRDPGEAIAIYGSAADVTTDPALLAHIFRARAALRWQTTDWSGTREDLARAQELAEAAQDLDTLSESLLLRAHVTWDPDESRDLEADLLRLLDRLPDDASLIRNRIAACLAGGLYQDGTTAAERPARARTALRGLAALATPPHQAVEAELLWWVRKGLLDVAPPEECAALAVRMEASAGGSEHHLGNALLAQVVDQLTMGRVPAARTLSARYGELATATGAPIQRYMTATLEGLWALYDGRYEDVQLATREAEDLGRFGGITATQVIEGQRVCLARDRGEFRTHPELVGLVDAVTPVDGAIPVWSAAVAWLHADAGDHEATMDRLRRIAAATDLLAAVPAGPHRLPLLSFVAEALTGIRPRDAEERRFGTTLARATYDALAAHPASGVLLGWPVAYLGSKQRYLGLAATAAGSFECAAAHLGRARRIDGARRPLTARNDLARARALHASGDLGGARTDAARAHRGAQRLGLATVVADAAELL